MLWSDTETFSTVPIKNGTYVYTQNCELMLYLYAIDDGPVKCWDRTTGEPMPEDLKEALENPMQKVGFHNSQFDRLVLKYNKLADLPTSRIHDTMVQALMHSLPGKLELLCDIFGLSEDQAKIKDGNRLIQLFCKPLGKNRILERATRETHPEEWERFKQYGMRDVSSMRIIAHKMPRYNWNESELALWRLDQKINDRGVLCDIELAKAALRAVDREKIRLAEETQDLTDGELQSTTKRDKMLKYICQSWGVDLPDLKMDTVERRLNDPDLPKPVKDLLIIRLQATTTSTSKYKSLLKGVCGDGRLRGLIQFCGASRTGRDAARLFQPQNMPRLNKKAIKEYFGKDKIKDKEVHQYINDGIEALKNDSQDLLFPNVMALCSNVIRSVLIASPGKKLVVADLSNIEGRGAAYLACEEWKLEAFQEYDNLASEDLYKLSYGRAFNVNPSTVDGDQRQIGKVMELMLQYEGGVGAFLTGAATYGIDLEALADTAYPLIPVDVRKEAEGFEQWKIKNATKTFQRNIEKGMPEPEAREIYEEQKEAVRYGLTKKEFIVCDSLKRMWRRAHPAISSYWAELKMCAIAAINNPNKVYECRKLSFVKRKNWLLMILPSGRSLCYPSPRADEDGKISYLGVNQYTRKWQRLYTYGGKLLENATQAFSRDVMFYNKAEAEAKGYEILLPVHDELITEAPDEPQYNVDELSRILATNLPWSHGLPLAAAGFEADRYRKD